MVKETPQKPVEPVVEEFNLSFIKTASINNQTLDTFKSAVMKIVTENRSSVYLSVKKDENGKIITYSVQDLLYAVETLEKIIASNHRPSADCYELITREGNLRENIRAIVAKVEGLNEKKVMQLPPRIILHLPPQTFRYLISLPSPIQPENFEKINAMLDMEKVDKETRGFIISQLQQAYEDWLEKSQVQVAKESEKQSLPRWRQFLERVKKRVAPTTIAKEANKNFDLEYEKLFTDIRMLAQKGELVKSDGKTELDHEELIKNINSARRICNQNPFNLQVLNVHCLRTEFNITSTANIAQKVYSLLTREFGQPQRL